MNTTNNTMMITAANPHEIPMICLLVIPFLCSDLDKLFSVNLKLLLNKQLLINSEFPPDKSLFIDSFLLNKSLLVNSLLLISKLLLKNSLLPPYKSLFVNS